MHPYLKGPFQVQKSLPTFWTEVLDPSNWAIICPTQQSATSDSNNVLKRILQNKREANKNF